ncbi:MAG: transglutaminase-like domain-containing protein, partial [Prevotellaceae bacterium]|nr:transglutaminase-like domain-containing protein [Prevotellaceae bacterium]
MMKRMCIAVALIVMTVTQANAQNQRTKEFLGYIEKYFVYKDFYGQGKYNEALASLNALINVFDTTTIHKDANTIFPEAAIKEQKGLFQYDKACVLALLGQKKQALIALEQSVDNGYKNYGNMLNDNDLVSLRKEKKFKTLLSVVESRAPIHVLKKSAPYGKEDNKESPFHYQSNESMNLRMVRDYFKLDSVAGNGDEMSKIINLLHFVHDNIRHDGGNRAFAEMDAIDLYNYHKTTGRGVNCRQLAISLCEMYLAMGIPARDVTCMPADPFDTECHVIK